jgi:hypothetical protein
MRRENVAAALKYLQDKADLRGRFERATSLDPQEQDLADIAVEGIASLAPGVGQALAARDVERARRANDPAGMAMAASGAIPGGRLAKLLKGFDPTRLELDVYHGTPHRFPATEANPLGEFDASKIGTGEGAQAYGHGIYYAESPDVARSYATMNQASAPSRASFIRLRDQAPQGSAEWKHYDSLAKEGLGSLYKADLPDEMIDRMLDWDAPVDESVANKIINAVRRNDQLDADDFEDALGLSDSYFGQPEDGRAIYKLLADSFKSDEKASEFLNEIGIPGIKYLDAGSRGKAGTGTRNFVVFPGEEKKVTILERK